MFRFFRSNDVKSEEIDLRWTRETEAETWLDKLSAYADKQGVAARDWYLAKKRIKKRGSVLTRYVAILLSAAAGLWPIFVEIFPAANWTSKHGLLVSLLIGVAAALVGLDRFAGYSTAWMRYMIYAQRIDSALQEFRLQWAAHVVQSRPAAAPPPPPAGQTSGAQSYTTEQVGALINLARQFLATVQQLIAAETSEWMNEFRSNLERLDSELQGRLNEQAKATREAVQDLRPGHLFVAFVNVQAVDEKKVQLELTSSTGKTVDEKELINNDSYAVMSISAGTYVLVISGAKQGQPFTTRHMFELKPSEQLRIEVDVG